MIQGNATLYTEEKEWQENNIINASSADEETKEQRSIF